MHLAALTMAQLRDLQEKVQQELSSRERDDLNQAREQIRMIAQQAGIPLKQLMLGDLPQRAGKVTVRYRHPDNAAEQWTGRGRQPLWVKNWIASGKSIDLLRV